MFFDVFCFHPNNLICLSCQVKPVNFYLNLSLPHFIISITSLDFPLLLFLRFVCNLYRKLLLREEGQFKRDYLKSDVFFVEFIYEFKKIDYVKYWKHFPCWYKNVLENVESSINFIFAAITCSDF